MKQPGENKPALLLAVYLILVIIIQGCSSQAPLCQSRWQDKPVSIDGKLTEWAVPLDFVDKGTKLNYIISNDDSDLYYWIRITDDKEQVRILRAGMQFWIDTTGKNKQQVGIQFPFSQLNGPDTAATKDSKKWTGKLDQMRLVGFHQPIGGITQAKNNYGIKVSIARDNSGATIYEACVPFKTFYKPLLSSADDNKQFGITMIINPMPEAKRTSKARAHGGDGGGYGGPGGMGLGYAGGDMGRYRSFQNDDDNYNLESATLKIALRLTAK